MKFLKKIQKQPEWARKLMLWTIIVIIGLVLLFWWARTTYKRWQGFSPGNLIEQLDIPDFNQ